MDRDRSVFQTVALCHGFLCRPLEQARPDPVAGNPGSFRRECEEKNPFFFRLSSQKYRKNNDKLQ
jgi:hypothetical protein